MLIRDLLQHKPNDLIDVSPDDDIRRAARLMVDNAVSVLIVETEDGELAGILTERDLARYFAAHGNGTSAAVRDAMTIDVMTCSAQHRVAKIAAVMSESNIRHLPVLTKGRVEAVVSIGDIVQFHMSQLEEENRTLRDLVAVLD